MTQPLRFEGRRVDLRLSDLPKEIRVRAARWLIDAEIKRGLEKSLDPAHAIDVALALRQVATDPETAALVMPYECKNKVFSVTVEEWDYAMAKWGAAKTNGRARKAAA